MTPGRLKPGRNTQSDRTVADGPSVMDRYRLKRRMGTGAFGTVWMAQDERLQRDVAVKILARQLISDGRFEREARAAARLQHPGIVTLYEAAVDDEGAYLVSELVRGDTLDTLLAAGELSDRDVIEIGRDLADALAHAHDHGVVHRDVKPSNVLVARDGPSGAVSAKLTDFGVARVIDSDALTIPGDVVGTLNYMAPEQAAGLEAGDAADLYSLALVLYEALSGVNPVRGSPAAQRQRRLAMRLPPLRRQRRDLPVPLAQAIDQALSPRIDDRGTITDLGDTLADWIDQMDDEPGVVTGAFDVRRREDDEPDRAPAHRLWFARSDDEPAPGRSAEPLPDPDPSRLIWQARALAAITAAAVVAWLSHTLVNPHGTLAAPLPLAALVAAATTLTLPRLGWIATVGYVVAATALQGHTGEAILVAAGGLVPMVLLPAAPTLWPVSAAAPALGLIGLAGAWPALAGYAHRPWRRAMLAATGWVWLALATPLAARLHHPLYLSAPATVDPRHLWSGSLTAAAAHVLVPLARSGVLIPAVVWALAAVIMPWLVRRTLPVVAVLAAVLWSTATVAALSPALVVLPGAARISGPATALAGAAAATVCALAPLAVDQMRHFARAAGFASRVP